MVCKQKHTLSDVFIGNKEMGKELVAKEILKWFFIA